MCRCNDDREEEIMGLFEVLLLLISGGGIGLIIGYAIAEDDWKKRNKRDEKRDE